MNNLTDIFQAELNGLAANFAVSWELKFLHWLRKTQAKLFSSESSCLLCGNRSLVSVREDEKCWSGCWGEMKQGHIFPKWYLPCCHPRLVVGGPFLTQNPPWLACQHTSFFCSGFWGNPAVMRMHARDFSHLRFPLPALAVACSHPAPYGRPITSPLLRLGPPPLCTMSLSLTLS